MEIKGKIKIISEVQQISEKFKKVDIVLEDDSNPKYPNYIPCQVVQDRCDLVTGLKVGDEITASINLRGREWINPKDGVPKYFVSVEIWKLQKTESGLTSDVTKMNGDMAQEFNDSQSNPKDDLPF